MRDPVVRLAITLAAGIVLVFTVLILTAGSCNGQGLRKHIAPAALVFSSGIFEGVMDHLQFHYDGSDPFWQPDISWKNKYRNRDPAQGMTFRGRYMVFTTDGWHLMKFGRNATLFAAITIKMSEKKKWYVYLAEGAAYWAINRAGFNVSYKLLNR